MPIPVYSHLDFNKSSQLVNAIIHTFGSGSLATILTSLAQLGYTQDDDRLNIRTSYGNEQIAYFSDIVENIKVFYQNTDPALTFTIEHPSIWFDTTDTATIVLKVRNIEQGSWQSITSTNGTTVSIPDYNAALVWPDQSMCIYDHQIFRNETGGDLTGTFTQWTLIGANPSTGRLVQYSIPTTLSDGASSGGVTRNGNTYTILHSFNKDFVDVVLYDALTRKKCEVDIQYMNNNQCSISFAKVITKNYYAVIKD